MLDISNDIKFERALVPQTIDSATTTVGVVLDLLNADDVAVILSGEITTGDFTMVLHHAVDSDFTIAVAVPDSAIKPYFDGTDWYETGQEVAALMSSNVEIQTLGLKKDQLLRYFRLSILSADTPNGILSGTLSYKGSLVSVQGNALDSLA